MTTSFLSGLIVALCTLVIISTIVEMYKRRKDIDEGYEIVFSILANSRWLIAKNKHHQQMACLNGIRVMSIIFVIMGHRYLMSIFFASVNTFEFLDVSKNLVSLLSQYVQIFIFL